MDVLKNCNFLDRVVRQSGGVGVAPCSQTAQAVWGDQVCHVQGGWGSFWLQGEEREYGISRTPRDNEVGSVVSSYILLLVYSNTTIIHDKTCT